MDNIPTKKISTATPTPDLDDDASDSPEPSEALDPIVEEFESDHSEDYEDDVSLNLIYAAKYGDLAAVKQQVEKDPTCLNCSEKELNLLHYATRQPAVIKYLTNRNDELYRHFNDDTTDLIAAAACGDFDFIQKELRARPVRLFEMTEREETIFYWAGFLLDDEFLDKLIALLTEITTAAISSQNLPKNTLQKELDDAWQSAAAGAYSYADTYDGKDSADVIAAARKAITYLTKMSALSEQDKADMKVYYNRIYNLQVSNNEHVGACHTLIEKLSYTNKKDNKILADIYHDIYLHYFESVANHPNLNPALAIEQFFLLLNLIRHTKGIDFYILDDVRESIAQLKKDSQILNYTMNLGFRLFDVPHDGNCFFHAIKHQLDIYNITTAVPLDHMVLRFMVCSHIRTHKELYRDYIEGPIDDYLEIMHQKNQWADNPEILALSRVLNVNIVIFRSDGSKPNIFKRSNAAFIFFLIYDVPMHYQSLQLVRLLHEEDDKILKELRETDSDTFINDETILRIPQHSQIPVINTIDICAEAHIQPIRPSSHSFFSLTANNTSTASSDEKCTHLR